MIRNLIKRIVYALQLRKLRKLATLNGNHYNIGPTGRVVLADGSTKEDVILGDYIDIHGQISSQNHGKISIGNYSMIGRHVVLQSCDKILIGSHVAIARETVISDNSNHPSSALFRKVRAMLPPSSSIHLWKYSSHKPIVIKNNAWIGEKSRICKGVTIGENSIVAANSVVTKDVPDNSIAAGNPAKIVREGTIAGILDPTDCDDFNEFIKEHGWNF